MTDVDIDTALRPLRLVVLAMGMGLATFGVIAAVLVTSGTVTADRQLATTLLPVLGLLALVEIPAYLIVRRTLMANLRHRWEEQGAQDQPVEGLTQRYAQLTIIGGAMTEGIGLFGIVVYLVSGHWLALLVPVIGLVLLIPLFPGRQKYEQFASKITGRPWE